MHKLKIGARAHDLNGQTPAELIALARETGIDGLQLAVHKSWGVAYQALDIDTIISNITLLQQAGLSIFLLASYFNPVHSDATFLASEIARARFNIDIGACCGIGLIGSETGSLNDDEWTWHPDNHAAPAFQQVLTTFRQLQPTLEQGQCDFLVEPVYEHVIHDADRLARLNAELGERFYVTLDIANLLGADNVDAWHSIVEDFLTRHGTRIRLFHFKNFVLQDGKKIPVRLDEGIIDYAAVLGLLAQHALTEVPIIVEELQGDELIASVAYLRQLSL
ncbi:sugar phosphate isomerase/epimerase family protein [Aeromonas piscicola]